jgi:hypothetical protein
MYQFLCREERFSMRVKVFGELSNGNRSVTLGGRSQQDYVKSWLNFDWFKTAFRPSERRGAKPDERVEYRIEDGTDSVTTKVSRHNDGSVSIHIDLPDLTAFPKDSITITIEGKGVETISLKGLKKEGGEQ